jgi:broad specificity phosphatase PhoE
MGSSVKNIITIQHTQSIHHTNGMIGSWTDWELSELGKEQAERIGQKLVKEIGNKGYVMYSSDLMRTKQTAETIGRYLEIKPIFRKELRERNLGSAVGKSVEWLHQNQKAFEKYVDDRCIEDAESRREVWAKLIPFYQEIMDSEEENIIIVSHGDTLSIFNIIWLGLEVEVLNQIDLFGFAGGVSFFHENNDGKHAIRRLSDLSYIQ